MPSFVPSDFFSSFHHNQQSATCNHNSTTTALLHEASQHLSQSIIGSVKVSKHRRTPSDIMVLSNPFDELPAELTTTVLGLSEPADILPLINADPHMLRVFQEHEDVLLRPIRQIISRQLSGENLTQAVVASRLRQLENTPLSRDRGSYRQVVGTILTQPRKALSVAEMKLGTISHLHCLCREVELFTSAYSRAAWEMTQDAIADYNRMFGMKSVRLPLPNPLLGEEREAIQMADLLFDSYRHTLWFSTSFLQNYYNSNTHPSGYDIHWEFAYGDKRRNVRIFDGILRFLLREYNRLLCQVDDALEGQSGDITSQLQTREFLRSSSRDNFQFPAYLCSQGYRPLLDCQEKYNATEAVLSLYTQYLQLRDNRYTCPLVVVAHLKDSAEAVCAVSSTQRNFWTSGAFVFDRDRLRQLDYAWYNRSI